MVVGPRVEFKTVEGDALPSYSNFRELWADFAIEAVLAHAQIDRGVTEAQEARKEAKAIDART